MLKKSLLSAAVFLSAHSLVALDINQMREECFALKANQQLKEFGMNVVCQGTFEDITKERSEVPFSNTNWRSAQIKMKSWETATDTGVLQGTGQNFDCSVYKKVQIKGPNMSFTIRDCNDLNTEFVQNKCHGLVKDVCKSTPDRCVIEDQGIVVNTCDLY
jgi:hypothetical protein